MQAIDTLTNCLGMVKDIPLSDANVFPEYILPSITKLADCEHSAVIVRVAFARNIGINYIHTADVDNLLMNNLSKCVEMYYF